MDFSKASPRSPKPSLQQMYKKKRSITPWKETYRRRCLDRLKSNRSNLVSKFRSLSAADASPLVEEMMVSEWQRMSAENSSTSYDSFDSFKNENVDRVNSIFEEMKVELLREEQAIVADYEANQQHDAAALEAAVVHQEAAPPQLSFLSAHQGDAQVCCPVCHRNPLMLNKGVIFCSCGVRIDTEQDCITLEFVGRNLDEGIQMHSAACQQGAPQFSVVKQLGIDNLLMTCAACDFWFVVI